MSAININICSGVKLMSRNYGHRHGGNSLMIKVIFYWPRPSLVAPVDGKSLVN